MYRNVEILKKKKMKNIKGKINDHPTWIDDDPFGLNQGKQLSHLLSIFSNHQKFLEENFESCIDRFSNEDKNYFVVFENHSKDLQTNDSFKN